MRRERGPRGDRGPHSAREPSAPSPSPSRARSRTVFPPTCHHVITETRGPSSPRPPPRSSSAPSPPATPPTNPHLCCACPQHKCPISDQSKTTRTLLLYFPVYYHLQIPLFCCPAVRAACFCRGESWKRYHRTDGCGEQLYLLEADSVVAMISSWQPCLFSLELLGHVMFVSRQSPAVPDKTTANHAGRMTDVQSIQPHTDLQTTGGSQPAGTEV